MNTEMQEELEEAARSIGDWLIVNANESRIGLTWKTFKYDNTQSDEVDGTLYTGTTGIILFLFELYKLTGDEKYKLAAFKGVSSILNYYKNYPVTSWAYLSGRFSCIPVFKVAYEITNDPVYIDAVFTGVKKKNLIEPPAISEYINGLAGSILSLTHLYCIRPDEEILDLISKWLDELVGRAILTPKGVCWDRSGKYIKPLCGFSHGVSGLGFVFNELGWFFKNKKFHWIADLAFNYENQNVNVSGNWWDFRKLLLNEVDEVTFLRHYREGNRFFYTTPTELNTWCHGAAGIGLSRIRAYEMTGASKWLKDFEKCTEAIVKTFKEGKHLSSYTLCHGSGGNAEALLEGYRVLNDVRYFKIAQTIAEGALEQYKKLGYFISGAKNGLEDPGLFLGTSGIGYFFLRMLRPHEVPSILAPRLTQHYEGEMPASQIFTQDNWNFSIDLIRKQFPKTLSLIVEEDYFHEQFKKGIDGNLNFLDSFVNKIQKLIKEKVINECVAEVFNFELTCSILDWSVESDALLTFKRRQIDIEKDLLIKQLTDKVEVWLQRDPDTKICRSKINLHAFGGALPTVPKCLTTPIDYLLIPTVGGVVTTTLSSFSFAVLKKFKSVQHVYSAVQQLTDDFQMENESEGMRIKQLILEQIVEFVKYGILINPSSHLAGSLYSTNQSLKNGE